MSDDKRIAPAPLPSEKLRWHCDPDRFSFETTAEVQPQPGIPGQESALEALRFGLEFHGTGQNLFVSGLSGTGRMTLVRRILEEIHPSCPTVSDRCYVRNFQDPILPTLISLPRGKGKLFADMVDDLADFIGTRLSGLVSSGPIQARITAARKAASQQVQQLLAPLEQEMGQHGFALISIDEGADPRPAVFPVLDGHPVPPEELDERHASGKISPEEHTRLQSAMELYQNRLDELAEKTQQISNQLSRQTRAVIDEAARRRLGTRVRRILEALPDAPIRSFLSAIVDDVIHELSRGGPKLETTRRYRVNLVNGHDSGAECPVIVETAPTAASLAGGVDLEFVEGQAPRADHLSIRAGALLRADGGYLILDVHELLRDLPAWRTLLRTLRSNLIEITPFESSSGMAIHLKPEPIPIQLKVVLIGESDLFTTIDANEPDFRHLFKVLVQFAGTIPRNDAAVQFYAGTVARLAAEEGLLPFDPSAVAFLVEHGARIAAQPDKLTARLGRLADIVREASFVAGKDGATVVTSHHVTETVRRTKRRADLPSRQFRELVARGTIRIETSGAVIGQVNGLAIMQSGQLTSGFPARITATVGPGSAGFTNVERKADLSGAIHTKAFFILEGLLRSLLACNHPIALDASLAFEQSYGGIDGDSASGAETCCLLSALARVPLRQDLAMTGATDQFGRILPVGGVNEKIEGFFDVCLDQGLSGSHGVIIPTGNAGELMLRPDVVAAGAQGQFHVYAVDSIQQALELLTGRDAHGVMRRAEARSRRFWKLIAGVPNQRTVPLEE